MSARVTGVHRASVYMSMAMGQLEKTYKHVGNSRFTFQIRRAAHRWSKVEPKRHVGMPNLRTDMHGVAEHVNMAGDTEERISAHPANSKPPDSPSGSTKPCPSETDGLESCPCMQRVRIQVHSVGDDSRTPANALESPDLPVRGAVPCMREPERPRDETDVPDMQNDAGNLKRPANMSETSATRDLPASDACTRTQSIVDDLIRPTDNSERIRIPQNVCKKSNSPARSQEPCPKKPEAQERCRCIRHRHACAEKSDQHKNDCKNDKSH